MEMLRGCERKAAQLLSAASRLKESVGKNESCAKKEVHLSEALLYNQHCSLNNPA